jgi:hypothetical protein
LSLGKEAIDEHQLGHLRFDAEDQIKYAEAVLSSDEVTANFILTNKVFELTKQFFDVRQLWTPAPKQRLDGIKQVSPEVYTLLVQFYQEQDGMKDRLETAKKIVPLVFERNVREKNDKAY